MLEVLSDSKAPVGDWSFVPEDSHSIAEYGQTVTMKVHCVPAASSRDRPESDVSSTKLPTVPLTKTRRVVAAMHRVRIYFNLQDNGLSLSLGKRLKVKTMSALITRCVFFQDGSPQVEQ
jgi:hypothetical protein